MEIFLIADINTYAVSIARCLSVRYVDPEYALVSEQARYRVKDIKFRKSAALPI